MYALSKAAFEADGREIVNCTVGGKLELFRRGDLAQELGLSPAPVAAPAPAPVVIEEVADPVIDTGKRAIRMLLIDMTPSGNGTATGELKQNLFGGMRDVKTLQICAWQGALGVAEDGKGVAITADAAETLIDVFAPDIILYRPTPNTPVLHAFAMKVIRAWRDTPLAVWIMDDWPESLKISDPEQALALDTDWRQLLEWSAFRLSISQRMSDAFEARYGKTFIAIANGVDPDQWRRGGLLVRYGGGLAENMGLDSVLRLAEAVDALAEEGEDIRLEILTRKHWETSAGARFKDFKRTQIKTNLLSAEKYREWLMGADVLAICYNFDEASRAYVQHSMANKLPECLASGATLIAHGPKHIATMAQVAALDCAIVVDEPSVEDIKAQLRRVIAEPAWAKALAAKAREIAFERFGLEQARSRFIAGVEASLAAGTAQLTPGSVRLGRVAGRLGRLARSMRRRDDGALEAKTGKPAGVA
jgi:glycosyltransferase involved in cell wall biosynthesis